MKNIYITLFVFLATAASCTRSDNGLALPGEGEREVEIMISTQKESSRAEPDRGTARERQVDELDLLIFKGGQYQYSRRAFRIAAGRYKATLKIDNANLTAYVFANCRSVLQAWEEADDQTGKTWEVVQDELTDTAPGWLVSDQGSILPMWGKTSGTVSETHVSGWDPVLLLRSVASVDVYVGVNDETSKFVLTDAHLYYAPDMGNLAPVEDSGGYVPASPADMQTNLNNLRAGNPVRESSESGGTTVQRDAIASKLYLYENDTQAGDISPGSPLRKFTRVIVAGYYDQSGPETGWKKSYYPLDFVDGDGNFHTLLRNYKYVFNITSVTGPGYDSLEEAADEYPIDMGVSVIDWNMQDEHIGVGGKYYVSIERRYAHLSRPELSRDSISLSYTIEDDIPGETFTLSFKDDRNGQQQTIEGGVENDHFRVVIEQDYVYRTALVRVTALRKFTAGNNVDKAILRFRDLQIEIDIEQFDRSNGDWEDGGNQDEELG